jgi:hypothetical protein
LVVHSQGRNRTFLVDLSGKHVVAYFQGRSSIFGWSVHDLDLWEYDEPLDKGLTWVDQTQYKASSL